MNKPSTVLNFPVYVKNHKWEMQVYSIHDSIVKLFHFPENLIYAAYLLYIKWMLLFFLQPLQANPLSAL
jgi:hypothetical protein